EVEGGQLDHANLVDAAVVGDFDDFLLRGLVFQLHGVAGDGNRVCLGFTSRLGRNHVETHHRAFFAANLIDHVVHAQADNVLHLAIHALSDSDDAVTGLQLPAPLGRTALDQFDDLGVLVLGGQLCADTLQRQTQPHVEVLGVTG